MGRYRLSDAEVKTAATWSHLAVAKSLAAAPDFRRFKAILK
jgi:hypothetical protein